MVEGARAGSTGDTGDIGDVAGVGEIAGAVRVAYGEPAFVALGRAIDTAKAGDPLAPVTLVVPSALAGITVRRRLASERGVAAIDTVVLAGLAHRLAAARLAVDGRAPLTPLEATAIARAVVSSAGGSLAASIEHPATIDALLRTFRELRALDAHELARLASTGPRAGEVVELFRAYRGACARWTDERDVVDAAVVAVRGGDAVVDELGTIVLYLPRRLERADVDVLRALYERGRIVAIVGTTGHRTATPADEALAERLAAIGFASVEPGIDATGDAEPTARGRPTIVRAADPADEARFATRVVLDRIAAGVPADRIAVVARVASPYALLVHEELAAAGIAHSAHAPVQLAQSITGRTLLGLIAWPGRGHRRDDLLRLLRAGPVRDPDGGRARPDRWDRLARDAGVVGGVEQWRQRLGAARRRLEQAEPDERTVSRLADLDALDAFVTRLAEDTDAGDRSTWRALAGWARGLVRAYVGGGRVVAAWSESEQRSHAAVLDLLDALGELDSLGPPPGRDLFTRVVEHELHRPAGRIGRFGHGVFVGRLSDVVGADLDTLVVLGCAEGVFPPRAADDPLIPDRDRLVVRDAMPRRGPTPAEEARDALAALAGARVCHLTFPTADPRDQHTRQPAPFVLEQAGVQLSARVDTESIADLRDDPRAAGWFVDLPSFEWWLASGGAPATPTELDVRELLAARAARRSIHELPMVRAAAIDRGLDAARARTDADFGPWSGSVGAWSELSDRLGQPRSPTSLQNWAECPFRYFLGHVLEVRGRDDPGEAETITPADRGTLVHSILERYVRARIEGAPADLGAIAADEEATWRAAGRTGRSILWAREWLALERHLAQVVDDADADPALQDLEPVAVEHRFGFEDSEAGEVVVDLGDGRTMRFRGVVDRIDRASDGSRVVVFDYKTGKTTPYEVLEPEHADHDIVARGTLLQLPVYARAALDRYPGADAVEAYYWFVGPLTAVRRIGAPIGAAADERFREVLRTVASGIEQGLFPARPGTDSWYPGVGETFANCRWCDFDALCPTGRGEQWVTISRRDELRAYVALAEGVADDELDAAGHNGSEAEERGGAAGRDSSGAGR